MTKNKNRQNLNKIVAHRLRDLRKSKKVTQLAVSIETGISRTNIVGYEKSTALPDLEKLYKLSEYYGVTCDYLLGRTNIKNIITS